MFDKLLDKSRSRKASQKMKEEQCQVSRRPRASLVLATELNRRTGFAD